VRLKLVPVKPANQALLPPQKRLEIGLPMEPFHRNSLPSLLLHPVVLKASTNLIANRL